MKIALSIAAALLVGLILRGPTGVGRGVRRTGPPGSTGSDPAAPKWLAEALAATRAEVPAAQAWVVVQIAALGLVVGCWVLAGWPLAVLAVSLLSAAPRLSRAAVARWGARRSDAQLPLALEALAASLRAGHSAATSVVSMVERAPEPLRTKLRPVAEEVRHGRTVGDAVDRWANQPGASPSAQLAAAAVSIGSRSGGAIAQAVDQVAGALRQHEQIRAESRALASQARASAGLLAAAPVGFAVLVSTVEPGLVRFLTAPGPGLLCLVGGVALELVGIRWMASIVNEDR